MALLVTPGQWGDAPQMIEILDRIRVPRPLGGRPRTRPGHVSGDKASSRRNRRCLRRRRIKHTIPEPRDQRANRRCKGGTGGRPAGFDPERYRRRNEVERTINRLKNSRAVATRYDKRAHVFHGTVTAAAIRLWLRPRPAGQFLTSTPTTLATLRPTLANGAPSIPESGLPRRRHVLGPRIGSRRKGPARALRGHLDEVEKPVTAPMTRSICPGKRDRLKSARTDTRRTGRR